MRVLVVDAANVVGSRPDGWWRDRAGAARRLRDALSAAALPYDEVLLVLEGAARRGVPEGLDSGVRVIHAPGSGDEAVVAQTDALARSGHEVTVVTADRGLRARVGSSAAGIVGPSYLHERL